MLTTVNRMQTLARECLRGINSTLSLNSICSSDKLQISFSWSFFYRVSVQDGLLMFEKQLILKVMFVLMNFLRIWCYSTENNTGAKWKSRKVLGWYPRWTRAPKSRDSWYLWWVCGCRSKCVAGTDNSLTSSGIMFRVSSFTLNTCSVFFISDTFPQGTVIPMCSPCSE